MQEFSNGVAVQESPTRAVQIKSDSGVPKLCTKPSCSPQLGDYSRQVHQAQCVLNQPEKMLGMPLDGERTAALPQRRKAVKHSEPAQHSPGARERRKTRKAFEAHPADRALVEAGSPETAAQRFVNAFGISLTLARFAAAFVRELKLRATCSATGIGYETGRTYLKQLFLKTGTHSQAQLAVLLVGVLGDG